MRTIVISGASRGIGLNIAHRELKAGNRISIGIRDLESVMDLINTLLRALIMIINISNF